MTNPTEVNIYPNPFTTAITSTIDDTTNITVIRDEYTKLIDIIIAPANSLIVDSPEEYTSADQRLSRIRDTKKTITNRLEEPIRPRYLNLELWYALKRDLLDPLESAEKSLKTKMSDYQLELSRKQREADRVRDEETRRLSQQAQNAIQQSSDPTLSKLDQARAKFKAKQAISAANEVSITTTTSIPTVKGTSSSFIPTETYEVTDLKAFLKGIVDGIIPIECAQVQVVNMNMFWKMSKDKVKGWPGVVVKSGGRIAGR